MPPPPAAPFVCDMGLDALRLETRDANSYAFAEASSGFTTFSAGPFAVIDRSSSLRTRVRGDDTTVLYSQSMQWPKNSATTIRAALGTSTIARTQSVRVMYQLKDSAGNTRVNAVASPSVHYAGGNTISCGAPNADSGIGECSGTLSALSWTTAQSVSLSLHWPDAQTVALADFGTVSTQAEPAWSSNGGWNVPQGAVTPNVAFGAVLPFEDMYIPAGSTRVTVPVRVYLKTYMAEDTPAERQIAVGQFKLLFPSPACSVSGDSSRNSAFATWETVSDLGAGEYGLLFMNGQVEGHALHMVTISLSCSAGTHQIGVETSEYADSNGLSSTVNTVLATSVGRADGYVTMAEVHVRATTEDVAVFAYPSDGRAQVNNLASIGATTSPVAVRLDSISDSPNVGRSVNVACSPSDSCTYTADPSASGDVSLAVSHGASQDTLSLSVIRPQSVALILSAAWRTMTTWSAGPCSTRPR